MSDEVSPAKGRAGGERAALETLDPAINSIQPGGGVCMRLELAWGALRRAWLKTFRRGYVARMREKRRGEPTGVPHEVLDPRDLKFYRNQTDCSWAPSDDPFTWRDRLPFARVGLAELFLIGGFFFAVAAVVGLFYWPASIPLAVLGLFIGWFFRNPTRTPSAEPGLLISPADGKVVTIEEVEHDEWVGGPAVVVGIFLSVFNVHINRVPLACRIVGMTYQRGKFLNALFEASVKENEQMHVRLEESAAPHRRLLVKQIAGAIARRIVCWVKPGDELARGEQFGMIKLGSRTELIFPKEEGLVVEVRVGQHIQAGSTVVARYGS